MSLAPRQILIASNRGPVSFVRKGGRLVPIRGGGGLVTALLGALHRDGGLWIASAMTEADSEAAGTEPVEIIDGSPTRVRYLSFPPETYDAYYNGISNRVLWFVHHYLWDIPTSPRFDHQIRKDWAAYRRVNRAFAAALVDEAASSRGRAVHLVQDYHLALVPQLVRAAHPDARISHFSHIPFAGSNYIRIPPAWMTDELLAGLLGADVVGFQADAWADNFLLACRTLSGARVNLRRRLVLWQGREVRVRVYPVTIDRSELSAAEDPAVESDRRELERWLDGCKLILRADRVELSKNIVRGFLAYEEMLVRHPKWRRKVRMIAFMEPSREDVPEYRRYAEECQATAARINREMGEDGWEPIRLEIDADRSCLLAAYRLYDVLMVNPVYDGMNLVAKEGPALNQTEGVLVLSQNAGAFAELGRFAIPVNPFDVGETSDALSSALQMARGERARRARGLRTLVLRTSPESWIARQLADIADQHAS
jgi:trehalose 6-phosphate synthase